MHRRHLLKTIATLPAASALPAAPNTRAWLGADYWANPLQDWRRSDGRIECHVSGGDRNVFWLSREIKDGGDFTMSVRLGRLVAGGEKPEAGWVGFRAGMSGYFDDYRDTAIRGLGLEAGITSEGRLFIGAPADGPSVGSLADVTLKLESRGGRLRLSAGGQSLEAAPAGGRLKGGVALVCHAGELPSGKPAPREPAGANAGKPGQQRGGNMRFWFRNWTLAGPGVAPHPERAWGPILFNQYTLSRGVLKMTVQLAPMEGGEPPLELRVSGRTISRAAIETLSSTATFRVEKWNVTKDVPYEVVFEGHRYGGVIRRDPVDKNEIVVGALTCQGEFGFPHATIARNLKTLNPDILFFTGDQIYEANGGYGIERTPVATARLDYLRKWYMFGWAWGELTRTTPCVCLPDDHDVYHGNIWGAGGRKAEYPPAANDAAGFQQTGQDSGGYTMAAPWINVVQRTQSSHLPDSPDKSPAEQGISVHYCHLVWGGISFAVLEDRKWKSAPRQLMPGARIRNGWPQNPEWDAAKSGDVAGAELLGDRQEKFLAAWARDWDEIEMKAAVSATIFCNLATLPAEMNSDAGTPKIPIEPVGGYAQGERITQDHDSNGWPQTPRNRALRLLRSCLAVHIAGDQHLGSTVHYGIDDWNDGPFALCTPAISNIFPRRWFPAVEGANRVAGAPRYTGEHRDGFGNRITVHAVANPHKYGIAPHALNDRAPGFGVVVFDKKRRLIRLTNWPRWADLTRSDAKPYTGWPYEIHQFQNGVPGAKWQLNLPERVEGVTEVYKAHAGEPVLAFRSTGSSTLAVWEEGVYTVRSGGREFTNLRTVPRKHP